MALWVVEEKGDALEGGGSVLPVAADLDLDLDAAVDFLLAALIIDAELDDVAVFQWKGARLDIGVCEPGVVEECA